jgi:hypothetical protein
MRYVELNATVNNVSGVISAQAYLELLPQLVRRLPTGARAFATNPQHYDFYSRRCVKDLTIDNLSFQRDDGQQTIEITFGHNCWKHEENLVITYSGVSSYELRPEDGTSDWTNLGQVILDEVLPHNHGCSHEIACRAGTLTIVSTDFAASWIPANCPEQPTAR